MKLLNRPHTELMTEADRLRNAPGWNANHKPSIRAKPGEAPSASWASQLNVVRLDRIVHALALGELNFVLHALYNPTLFEIWDQLELESLPGEHPLQSHPDLTVKWLPSHRGTLTIADSLGVLKHHPMVKVQDPDDPDAKVWMPKAWIGDFLLFMFDSRGPYCVYWDVKDKRGMHDKPGPRTVAFRTTSRSMQKAAARYAVQKQLFAELKIRIVPVAAEDLDRDVNANLRQLFGWSLREPDIHPAVQEDLLECWRRGLEEGDPPFECTSSLVKRSNLDLHECKRLFYQSIWGRRLRVDLFEPIVIDKPMVPEDRDVLELYSNWFAR